MEKLVWRTETRKVGDLKLYGKNPRKMSTAQKRRLMDSLEKFGVVEIPAVDTDGTIVAGNQRVKSLLLMDDAEMEIDVRVPNRKLTDEEFKEYCLKSNSIDGEFDMPTLLENFNPIIIDNSGIEEAMKKINREQAAAFRIPEMELKSFESYDYLVFVFKDMRDMVFACDQFDVKKVNGSYVPSIKKIGIGRVLDGKVLVERLQTDNTEQG